MDDSNESSLGGGHNAAAREYEVTRRQLLERARPAVVRSDRMAPETLLSSERPIPADAVRELYDAVAWWPDRSVADIAEVLTECLAVGAWRDGRLIGFARAISDRRFHAYIDDVVVHPDHQRTGVGGRLVTTLVDALSSVDEITLFCDEEHVRFYERLGFRLREAQRVLHVRPTTREHR